MSIAQHSAVTSWEGALATGAGSIVGASGALSGMVVTWAARTEQPGGKTSPGELAAAAHSSCYAMALALRLGEMRLKPQRLRVEATFTLDDLDGLPTIISSNLVVRAQIQGLDADRFTRPSMRLPPSARFPGCSPGPDQRRGATRTELMAGA